MSDSTLREKSDVNKPTMDKPEAVKLDAMKLADGKTDAVKSTASQSKPSKSEPEFTVKNIGKWASRQENPFADQNRKAAAKKQKANEARKKATPIVAVVAAVIATGVAIFGLVMLIIVLIDSQPRPDVIEIAGGSTQDIVDYQNILMDFYNQNPYATPEERVQNIQNIVNGTLGSESGKNNSDAVLYAQLYVYVNEGLYQEIVDVGEKINVDKLNDELKSNVYNAMTNAYYALGDQEKANIYRDLLIMMPVMEE